MLSGGFASKLRRAEHTAVVAAFRQPLHQDPHAVRGSARCDRCRRCGRRGEFACRGLFRVSRLPLIPMIHYLARSEHTYTVGDYLKSWAGPSHPIIKILAYERLPTILPRGTYVFSDLERLTSSQSELMAEAWDQLAAAGDGIRLLNHPIRSLRRFALLRQRSDAGRNAFRAFRASEPLDDVRFPVFVRRASEHDGSATGLLRDHRELDQAIVRALLAGIELEDVLIVEFCDTSHGSGRFRKYSRVSRRRPHYSAESIFQRELGAQEPRYPGSRRRRGRARVPGKQSA